MLMLLAGLSGGCAVEDAVALRGDVRRVEVRADAGEIQVIGTEEAGVRMRRIGSGGSSLPVLDGGELRVDLACDPWQDCGLLLEVPAMASVMVEVGQGRVEVEGVRGGLSVEVGQGAVEAAGLGGGVSVRLGVGTLSAEFATVPAFFQAGAGAGEVRLTVPMAPYALSLPPGAMVAGGQVGGQAGAPIRVEVGAGTVSVLMY